MSVAARVSEEMGVKLGNEVISPMHAMFYCIARNVNGPKFRDFASLQVR